MQNIHNMYNNNVIDRYRYGLGSVYIYNIMLLNIKIWWFFFFDVLEGPRLTIFHVIL